MECGPPDRDTQRLDARVRLLPPFVQTGACATDVRNALLQSSVLRNTAWACGVAVYTGVC